jgi:RecJ-like exonuclease
MANNEDAIDLMREVDALRRALVEAGRCVECDGRGRVCVNVACIECRGTGIRSDLTSKTQAVVARAKEATNG